MLKANQDRLWRHMPVLCEEIGPRLSGTAGDERAAAYIAESFRDSGAEVEIQNFACPGWDHEFTELTLFAEDGPAEIPALAQTFSQGCDVEAELVEVVTQHQVEYAPDLEGKIFVVHGEMGAGIRSDRSRNLLAMEERRPAAIIVFAHHRDTILTKQLRDPFIRVPAVGVSAADGARLLRNVGRRARVRVGARRYDSVSHNVIGRLPGKGPGRVVLGAHYDTAANTPGAKDDASGVAVVLEVCEALAGLERGLSVDCIAFGAEEYGRHSIALGSVEYVRRHPDAVKETRAAVQVDGVGTVVGAHTAHLTGWSADEKEEIVRTLRRFPEYVVDEERVFSSDHRVFHEHGAPTVAFMNSEVSSLYIHTPLDTLDQISPEKLTFAAEAVGAVVALLADVRET